MKSSDSKKSDSHSRGRRSSADPPQQPSPSAPPMPQEPPKPFLLPPWTPNPKHQFFQQQTHYIQNENNENVADLRKESDDNMMGMIDDESVPSIPDVPSPYSPPPASLFSGEEFPSKSHRKSRPFDDLALLNNHRLIPQSQNIFNSSIPSDEEYHSHQPYSSHRQQLLPTILYLKKDLEESHASMHLLQQENKALAAECDRFQREMERWNDQHTITVAEKDEQIAELKKQLLSAQHGSKDTLDALRTSYADCKEELEKVSKQLEVYVASNSHLEACNCQLKNEVATKDTEIKNLRSTIKDQSLAAATKLNEATAAYGAKVQLLQDECKSLTMETDRLKAMNVEAIHRGSKDLAQAAESFRAELSTIQCALTDAQKEMEDLKTESLSIKSDLAGKNDEIKKLSQQLDDAVAEDARKGVEIKGLRESLFGSTEREQQLKSENESLRNTLAREAKERNDEINLLQQALQKAESDEKALQTSAAQMTEAFREAYTKYGALCSEKVTLEKEVSSLRNNIGATSSTSIQERNHELESEVERLKASLSKAVTKCNDFRAERSALTKKLSQYSKSVDSVPPTREEIPTSPEFFKFENAGSDNDDLIPTRLERIRDAAERAAFAKEQRRELHRLKAEHDKEVKRLTARHEQDLKDVFEEAKAEVTARSREIRRHLQGEYETKIANFERRYQSDLSRMQRECDKSTAVAEEAMKAAAAELAAVTEQLDKESSAREALESSVRDLELKLVTEQQKSKLSSEWMMNRKQWQRETNNLIVAIQQECNTVFSQNLVRTNSPRSVADASTCDVDMTEKSVGGTSMQLLDDSCLSRIEQGACGTSMSDMPFPVHRTPWKKQAGNAPKTSYNSPLDVSQALDETEALVRSLVGK